MVTSKLDASVVQMIFLKIRHGLLTVNLGFVPMASPFVTTFAVRTYRAAPSGLKIDTRAAFGNVSMAIHLMGIDASRELSWRSPILINSVVS